MKDSGAKWLGMVPDKWNISRIKYISDFSPKCIYRIKNDEDVTYTPMECVKHGYFINQAEQYGNITKSLTTFMENDIIMAKVTPCFENGNIAIAKNLYGGVGFGSSELFVYRAKKIEKEFLFYWLQNNGFVNAAASTMHGVGGLKRVSSDFAKNAIIAFPDVDEQKKIVRYLDKKCSEIADLYDDLEQEIQILETYKKTIITETVTKGLNKDVQLSDSGVQWIGLMPAHWKCYKGKYLLRYMQKPVKVDDGVITCFRDGEVTLRSNRREDGFTMSDKEIGYQGIDIGDLVVHGMDGFAGSIGISDSRGKASPVLNVLDTDMDKKYVMYYLRSMAYSDVFLALATGIRVRSCDLRWNKLAELLYPVPPKEEQIAISQYIDKTIEETNKIIEAKKRQLEILDEYKKSLIYEYVTGKKEVPAV